MRPKILLVDDQQQAMRYHWSALERAGFEVTRCDTTRDAIRAYNDDHFDLIILDRMLPPGEALDGSETEMDLQTGYRIYDDLRQRHHLKRVPIIILTNFYEAETAHAIEDKDERALVLGKDTLPSELVAEVHHRIEVYPVDRQDTVIPLTEHPNVAPYYVWDTRTGERRRVYFDYYREADPKTFDNKLAAPWYWRFGDVWQQYLSHDKSRTHILKAVLHEAGDEPFLLHGVYYTGGDSPVNWYKEVLFESAPWSRYDAGDQRRLRGVGKVMVARFIRQCLRNYGHYEPLLIAGETRLNPEETAVGISARAREFFTALGFTQDPRSQDTLLLEHDAAMRLLNEVSGRTEETEK
ncbi:MAG: hypothetical protein OHK0029_27870 [Armatimonadaceae bacterium]